MSEVWKEIPGYGGHYEASDAGRVRVKERVITKFSAVAGRVVNQTYKARLLKPCDQDKWGHQVVHFGVDGKRTNVMVHKLVMLAFVGPAPAGMECCHGNGDARDNRLSNLRWDTHLENNRDRKRHGRYATGSAHPMWRGGGE